MTLEATRVEWLGEATAPEFAAAAVPGLPAEPFEPGASAALLWRGDVPVARLAVYLREDLEGAPGRTGLIGHYAAHDLAAGVELLAAAVERLRAEGAVRALGPMNGSTWARYRFALPAAPGTRGEPPFLGEPQNPEAYPDHFERAGLTPVAWYVSTAGRLRTDESARARERAEAVAGRGVLIEPIAMERFGEELAGLHDFSVRAFADNPYFSPIGVEAFVAQYAPLERLIDPALVLLARGPDLALAGYILGFADPCRPDRLVVKTLVVDPAWRSIGLGAHLVEDLHAAARARGLTAAIHALMHVENRSTRIATGGMAPIRTYALYARELA